jgi:diguanylate cyclase
MAEILPLETVESALNQSEAIEVRVQEAAEELCAVNDALAQEIDARHDLEDRLERSHAALVESRVEERRSRHSALHVAVTGLPNLTLFHDRLGTALAQAERHTRRLAVMFMDLDGFKDVNDMYGHDAGDSVLRMVARRLESAVRAGDTVCRRSGDEFLVLMLEAKDESSVESFVARLRNSLADAFEIGEHALTVSASIGIALYPDDGSSVRDLLKKADAAMYAAKEQKAGPG